MTAGGNRIVSELSEAVAIDATPAVCAENANNADRAIRILIITSGLLTGLSMSIMSPVLPAIAETFAATAGESYLITMVVAIVGLAVVTAAPAAAIVTRLVNCSTVLALSFAVYAGAAIFSSIAQSLELLIAARFVQGIAVAIGLTTVLALTAVRYSGKQRNTLLGMHLGFSAFGLMALLPVAGYLGEANWRLAPLIGLVSLFHLTLVLPARRALGFRFPRPAHDRRRLDAGERVQVARTIALSLLIGAALYSPSAFLPFKLARLGYGSPQLIAIISTISMALASLGSFAYARVRLRVGGATIYMLAVLFCATGNMLVAMAEGLQACVVGLVLAGMAGGLLLAHLYGDTADRFAPDLRVTATGMIKSSSFAGLFLGPLALQLLVAATSADAAFTALALVLLLLLPIAMMRDNHRAATA